MAFDWSAACQAVASYQYVQLTAFIDCGIDQIILYGAFGDIADAHVDLQQDKSCIRRLRKIYKLRLTFTFLTFVGPHPAFSHCFFTSCRADSFRPCMITPAAPSLANLTAAAAPIPELEPAISDARQPHVTWEIFIHTSYNDHLSLELLGTVLLEHVDSRKNTQLGKNEAARQWPPARQHITRT